MSFCSGPEFLRSAAAEDSDVFPLQRFDDWCHEAIDRQAVEIERIPFRELTHWTFEGETGNLVHDSGGFFAIDGVEVETNFGDIVRWSQPIIDQPEIGSLGILVKSLSGVLHFLLQAKMEPGNINTIQLAPTLQATKSNYTQVHGGKIPSFLTYFHRTEQRRVIVDVLQSEQGGRFLRKRNRNIIVVAPDEEFVVPPDYLWLTLGQILRLLRRDNVVNMDARSALSCIWFQARTAQQIATDGSTADGETTMHSIDEVLAWLTEMKCRYDLAVTRIGLNRVTDWQRDEYQIYHSTGNYFTVMAARVKTDSREIQTWSQPLVKPCHQGLIAFIVRFFGGTLHFLLQAKVEVGNLDVVEIAPTVQCLTGDYTTVPPGERPPFLDWVLSAPREDVLFDTLQSEEGGRFFREANRNLIVLPSGKFQETIPRNYLWVSYAQLKTFIRFNNIVNVQCRCLLSCINPADVWQPSI